jgi:DNA-directed RNA polymerase subunit N (RpoN/RPB10)
MRIDEYINHVLKQSNAEEVYFDIGVDSYCEEVHVMMDSTNRVKFTIQKENNNGK